MSIGVHGAREAAADGASLAHLPLDGPTWLLGAGNMAGAMLARWLVAGLDPARVTVIRKSGAPVAAGVRVVTVPPAEGPAPVLFLVGVKPQMLDAVAPTWAPLLGEDTLLVSILAGVEIASLRRRFPAPRAVLRALPNTPVALGKGVVGLHGEGLCDAQRGAAESLMAALGLVEWVAADRFDQVTALAGSGPAFLFRFVDALASAGAASGLPLDQARRLALATVEGAAALAIASPEDCGTLADRVASPGGSTRKGLDVLDADGRLDRLLEEVIAAAVRRNAEMAADARG